MPQSCGACVGGCNHGMGDEEAIEREEGRGRGAKLKRKIKREIKG